MNRPCLRAFRNTAASGYLAFGHLIVGCQAGGRSQRATEIMAQAGYTNVANMQGGFGGGQDQMGRVVPGWRDSGLPVSTENGEDVSYASLATKAGVKA